MSITNKILKLLHEQGKSQADICKYLGIKQNVFTTWKTRGTDPPAKFIVQICEFFNISLEYLLIDEEDETKKGKFNINMGSNNEYNSNVQNATGKTVTINNVVGSQPKSTSKNQEHNGKYPTVIMYFDSLDEKNKRHAVVDVEYMLESEYHINEQTIEECSEDTGYQRIIGYLDSLDKKTCRHAIVDVEYLLEVEYGVKKKQ
ncbi:MAG: helix-turn-helix domain containing protein [Ruminococcus flavefaciens]|nr:helix-turn-helix domain containing protein [Ruminococcus flavefaciens]